MRNSKFALLLLVSCGVALFFGYATHSFVAQYTDFEVAAKRLTVARDQVEQAQKKRLKVDQYNRAMQKLEHFTSQVESFGLTADNWQTFDVSVDRSLTFTAAGNILDQLSHSKNYYFQPVSLYIGTGLYRNKPVEPVSRVQTAVDAAEQPELAGVGPVEPVQVEPQAVGAIGIAAEASTETGGRGGDLTMEVQGQFIVRGGS
ncbi:MAG: hypothetical protein U9R56_07750 [candidate division Zixibacteria bacterium]|nr:hypothetical protein [candidate division Zixibacteria bacterium]